MTGRGRRATWRFSTAEWGVVVFTAAYMLAALASLAFKVNAEFVYYFVVMCLLIALVGALHFRVRLHPACLWGLSLWGLAHLAGGLVHVPASWPVAGESHVLYNLWLAPGWLKFDQAVHAYGFGIVTWVVWQGIERAFRLCNAVVEPTVGLLVIAAAAGMGAGAANEVVEFAATQMLPDTNVGGYENTGWDLVANAVGAITAAALIRLFSARTSTETS